DPDGDSISFAWKLVSRPDGSVADLANQLTATPTLTPDLQGTYVAGLSCTDQFGLRGHVALVTLTFTNVKPVANAGTNQSVAVGTQVTLDGSASSDANGDSITYLWSLTSVPSGSAAALANPTSVAPTFTPDVQGTYVAGLVVNDGLISSDPSTVTVSATSTR